MRSLAAATWTLTLAQKATPVSSSDLLSTSTYYLFKSNTAAVRGMPACACEKRHTSHVLWLPCCPARVQRRLAPPPTHTRIHTFPCAASTLCIVYPELEELRRKRLAEMQRQAAERQQQAVQGFGTLSDLQPGHLLVGGPGKRQTDESTHINPVKHKVVTW